MKTSIASGTIEPILNRLGDANDALQRLYPGEADVRQPVHTVYGGAHLFKPTTAAKLGDLAVKSLDTHAPNFVEFAQALGWDTDGFPSHPRDIESAAERANAEGAAMRKEQPSLWLAATVYRRVREKLAREAVEDFRIDFEDGFGHRPDDEEDGVAVAAAGAVAEGMEQNSLPPFIGIRIKPLTNEMKARAIRTLDLFLSELCHRTGVKLPDRFVITLPKVTIAEQVTACADVMDVLERVLKLPSRTLKIEIMVETNQSIFNGSGQVPLPLLVKAGRGRIVGAHFGTYDYTASCQITASHQAMDHMACDFARQVMKVTLANRPIFLSDGATNVMPVGSRETVISAWRLAYSHITHSLKNAFYQGWDLHPAQLPIRYAACYHFFLSGLDAATARLKSFIEKAAQATLLGDVFDDAATGQGLLNYFLRALNCGAITLDEVKATGLTLEEVQTRSFSAIVAKRG